MTVILSVFLMMVDVSLERLGKAYVDDSYCTVDIHNRTRAKAVGGRVMLVKWGVWGEVHEELVRKFSVITEIWDLNEPVITSIGEGTHVPHSRHYHVPSKAIDLRNPAFKKAKVKALQEELGSMFTVIDEGNHIHLQWNG